jgi:hypothetical protein
MASENRGVAYIKPGEVRVQSIDFPKLINPTNKKKAEHGVILKIVSTNICGSDQHMVRGRTTAPAGLVLGHEITGEIIEKGRDVETLDVGDIVSVPFNIACGRCRNCKEGRTGICLRVNPARPGAAYGYVDMGGWVGGQAEFVMVPYADFNLLKFANKEQAMAKIKDLTLLSDIFPTGFHGAVTAGVGPGSKVYVAGAGRSTFASLPWPWASKPTQSTAQSTSGTPRICSICWARVASFFRSIVSQPNFFACLRRSGIMSPTMTTAAPSRWQEVAHASPTGPAPAT